MDELNSDELFEKYRIVAEQTLNSIQNLEKDMKETVNTLVLNEWDPENLEIIDQLSELVVRSENLKEKIMRKDIEIFQLRETISDKRKRVKISKAMLESLNNKIQAAEESLVINK